MSGYVTPITDRAATDVDATPTSKGYFNVADWTRIYGNAKLTVSLAAIMLPASLPWTTITAPTITSFPTVTDFDALLLSIETMRAAVAIPAAAVAIKDDYIAGVNEEAPDYNDVNLWESTIDAIWLYYDGDLIEVCPSLSADLTLTTDYIVIDCIDTNGHTLDTNGHTLYII